MLHWPEKIVYENLRRVIEQRGFDDSVPAFPDEIFVAFSTRRYCVGQYCRVFGIESQKTMPDNACLACGACCAAFRIDFHYSDLATAERPGVPPDMAVPVTERLFRMRGSDDAPPRCIALAGEIGREVHCTIYENRPGPCRDFAPYAPLGVGDDACDRARRRHGLSRLGAR